MKNNNIFRYILLSLILFFALILRLFLSQSVGYELDINHFTYWSQEVCDNGFSSFYQNTGADYPPFYIYILWILGAISHIFNIDISILLKFPAIIADIATCLLIFHIVKKYSTPNIALLSTTLYAFNPAIIYNSAIWGQVDSIYVFFLLFSVYEFTRGKILTSSSLFAISVLTKPQSLVLAPLFIILILKKYSLKDLIKCSTVFFILLLVVAKPFFWNTSIHELFYLYGSSYTQYPFTSLNAFNFWSLFGMFKPDSTLFLSVSYRIWGYILFIIFFVHIVYKYIKINNDKMIYLISSILFFGFFMLMTRIHERYIFPMFAFFIIAAIFDKRLYLVYVLLSITFLANLYLVFEEVKTGMQIPMSMFIITYSTIINIILFIYLVYLLYYCSISNRKL